MKPITEKRLKEVLDYRDGEFYWKVRSSNRIKVGDTAGYLDTNGYIVTRIDGQLYRNNRLVWLWFHGYMPEQLVDHKDRNKTNNLIQNLRVISSQCNNRNIGQRANTSSGVKGVYWHPGAGKWMASIAVDGKIIYLGLHNDLVEAACHRLAAEQSLGWEGCDSSSPCFVLVSSMVGNCR